MNFWKFGLKKNNPRRLLTQRNGRDQIKGRTKYERTINCRASVKNMNNKLWENISGKYLGKVEDIKLIIGTDISKLNKKS